MKIISIVENEWLSMGGHDELTTLEVSALTAAASALPKGCLEWLHNRVKFKQFCGVVQIQQQLHVKIPSKVFSHQNSEQQRTTLIEMLNTAGGIKGLHTQ